MAEYIEFITEEGNTIWVEVAEDWTSKGTLRTGLGETVQTTMTKAQATFEDALEVVRSNASAFIKKLRKLSDVPDEIEVTFGLKAVGEMGNFAVAKAGAEANYTVTLTWKKSEKKV